VTGYDVWGIVSGLKLAPQQFLVYSQATSNVAGAFKLDQSGNAFDIALDKVRDDRQYKPCIFLAELPGGGGRCGIHAFRPHVCQTYPALTEDSIVALRKDVLCPTGAWKLVHMNVGAWQDQIHEFVLHRDIYEYVVQLWNRRVDSALPGTRYSIDTYYDFLLNFYQRLAVITTVLSENSWIEIVKEWNVNRSTHVLIGDEQDSIQTKSACLAKFCRDLERLLKRFKPSVKQDSLSEKQNINSNWLARGKPDNSLAVST
jgi:Fe-S-cluster containining protein